MPGTKAKRPSSEQKKRPQKKQTTLFACATPVNYCTGKRNKAEGSTTVGLHASQEECISCKGQYLQKQGYVKKSKREWICPDSGRIMVLSRKAPRAKPVRKNEKYLTKQAKFLAW